MTDIRVSVRNTSDAEGTFLTPFYFGFHDGTFDLFDVGSAAPAGLEAIAEDGNVMVAAGERLAVDPDSQGTVVTGAGGPIAPGELGSRTLTLTADQTHATFAAMILPSNDAFVGTDDALALFDANGNFAGAQTVIFEGSDVYDAGTEVNTELDAAFINQTGPNTGITENGVVRLHDGFNGSAANPLGDGFAFSSAGDLASIGTTQSPSDLVAEAVAENLYYNIHTTNVASGEIRGQLLVQSDVTESNGDRVITLSASLDSAQEPFGTSSSTATGSGVVVITVPTHGPTTYTSDLSVDGIDPADLMPVAGVSAIHIHNAPAGSNGGVILDVVQDAGADINGEVSESIFVEPGMGTGFSFSSEGDLTSLGTSQSTSDLVAEAVADNLYYNIHTTNVASGEIRGQLLVDSDVTQGGVRTITLSASLDSAQEPGGTSTSAATGTGAVVITVAADGSATYTSNLTVDGIDPADLMPVAGISAIHIHNAPAGSNGGVILDVVQDTGADVNGNITESVFTEFDQVILGGTNAFGDFIDPEAADFTLPGAQIAEVHINVVETTIGTDGVDVITGSSADDIVDAGDSGDVVVTRGGFDEIDGGEGDDTISSGSGDDIVLGGLGSDTISAGSGRDFVSGGNGSDSISAGNGDDVVNGGNGSDTIEAGGGDDLVRGGEGNDTIAAGGGDDIVNAGNGADTIIAGAGADDIRGGGGADTISAGSGDDFAGGGDGADTITAGGGDDIVNGGNGSDVLSGGSGSDTIRGGDGDDVILGGADGDSLSGNDGADTIDGGLGDDSILGGLGDDILNGNGGNDTINSGGGADVIIGGRGDDTIEGGLGDDLLTGGIGNDSFVFAGGDGNDVITDFGDNGDDLLVIDVAGVSSFDDILQVNTDAGTLLDFGSEGQINLIGTASVDADDFMFA